MITDTTMSTNVCPQMTPEEHLEWILDMIISFVPEFGPYLRNPDVTDIMVNPDGGVYTERDGMVQREPVTIKSIDLEPAVQHIAYNLNEDVGEHRPTLQSRLPDGSRVAAMFPPVSVGGISLSIRRFPKRYTVAELVERGMLTEEQSHVLAKEIEAHHNIMISGGTSSGKTTLLNALTEFIPAEERMVVIEDVAEIHIDGHPNVVRLEARLALGKMEAVTIRDCLRQTLRLRPDRIFVGEVRGAEAYDLLEAWNTGHQGSMTTIHADSAERSLFRLANAVMQAAVIPPQAVRQMISDCLHTVVHIRREQRRRYVAQILRVVGFDEKEGRFQFAPLGLRKTAGRELTAMATN